MSDAQDPLKTEPVEDTGAETLQRYRFQAAYAAWLAVGALDELPDVVAVYCEHHEDALLEFADGTCEAIQVKSQADGIGPLRGTNESVLGALRRFISLEHAYGARFRRYRLASIAGFHKTGKSASNLEHCLAQSHSCDDPKNPEKPLASLLEKLKVPNEIPASTAIAALRKVALDATLPKLADIELRVRRAIEQLPETGQYRASDLARAAEAVIGAAAKAGEATKGTAAPEYVAYMDDPEACATKAAIEAKRLSCDTVRALIHDAVEAAAALRSQQGTDVEALPRDLSRSHIKMDAGGLPVHTVDLLDDLRASVEEELERRLYRDGPRQTNADYDHLQVLVRSLSEEARLAARTPSAEYGQEMLLALRQRLREQAAGDPSSTRGLSVEQLTGLSAILTELCQVWWSEPFELQGTA